MKGKPYFLDCVRREAVLESILEVCRYRGWHLLAAHVRTNHVHVALDADVAPEQAMNSLKAYASRKLNAMGIDGAYCRRWARHGSTRYLWTAQRLSETVGYVVSGQGEAMAVFEAAFSG